MTQVVCSATTSSTYNTHNAYNQELLIPFQCSGYLFSLPGLGNTVRTRISLRQSPQVGDCRATPMIFSFANITVNGSAMTLMQIFHDFTILSCCANIFWDICLICEQQHSPSTIGCLWFTSTEDDSYSVTEPSSCVSRDPNKLFFVRRKSKFT